MQRGLAAFSSILCLGCAPIFLIGCRDGTDSSTAQSQPGMEDGAAEDNLLRMPLDLVYICGNKFLASNSTLAPVQLSYRVAGTDETGYLSLPPASGGDEGFSETEFETAERGTVEVYQGDQRVARRRNEAHGCGPARASASITALATSASAGEWSAPFAWPVVAVHLSLLPSGKVLSWGAQGSPQVWDPATGIFTGVPSPSLLFCGGHSFLADGRLLVSGGHISTDHGLPNTNLFTTNTESWSRSAPMGRGRWYPTSTTLASGDVLILAGRDEAGVAVLEPEVWSSGGIRVLSTASKAFGYYPRTFLAPNGKIFYAGHSQGTHYLDVTGTGSWTKVANRLYGVREYGAAAMYDEGKIIYVGGGHTTNTAEIIDLNSALPVWQWTGSMAYPRRHHNATVLPTGEVLVTGGSSSTFFSDITQAVHAAEVWNPSTGNWTTLARNTIRRSYHSTSILLPDGTLLHAGSGDTRDAPDELNAEIFSPPYLFKGSRPSITAAPSLIAYGTTFKVNTPEASEIIKVSLVRLGSTTHAHDMNQRFQWLSFTSGGGALTIAAPTSRNRTPPGHYMLFILDGNGVPSIARIVKMGSESEPAPPAPNVPPAAAFSFHCIGLTCDFDDGSTDEDGAVAAWRWSFGDGATSTIRNPSHSYDTEGDYEVVLTVTDDAGSDSQRTHMVTVPPPLAENVPPVAAFTASCANLQCSFVDGSADSDGNLTSWLWDFGDGSTSTLANPDHSYANPGAYPVSLTVTDDDGAVDQHSGSVTATAAVTILLNTAGRFDGTRQYMTLTWTGASGSMVDVYRNGVMITATPNDGQYINSRAFTGYAIYVYKLCLTGTGTCSNESTVMFNGGSPAGIALTVTGRFDGTKQHMTLIWTGASGPMVDVYRNGSLIKVTENDGRYTNSRTFTGAATYIYKLCQAGTSICSKEATVVFK